MNSPSPQSSDGTTSHSTRLSKDNSQVAGYPASGRGGEREKPFAIPDHAQRVRAQLQQAAEQREFEQLLDLSSPLLYAVYLAAFLAVLAVAVDGWQRYKALAAEHRALVSCINGQALDLDGAILRCEVHEYARVPGLVQLAQYSQGEQP